ncbi:CelD/BcsL family acetyltransferase involved in cellulose biosynthesis [Inhella inkyongensis]|uniref:CelD/BcsL family acetyltransferase involved in cellulose biosynthesis n=1 Tax=Inhella inkyongensis TaxID=392593 RepID=A0A840S377_9BURK|nr:GNAT family N-acetyltransferase [Inhella inkyongensis]MBB5203992.1 CelD/BcsL family acetyltransferase involved in cellulose biosynthesis [Inhella inkyongensis]
MRYRLGELLLAQWWPRLALVQADPQQSAEALRAQLPPSLPEGGEGFVVRGAPAAGFPLGVRRCGAYVEYVARHDPLHVVDVAGPFDDYLRRQFSPKSRQNLQRSVRKVDALAPAGALAWTVATAPGEMAAFLRQAAAISRHTYQTKMLGVGLEDNASTLAAFEAAAHEGQARGYLLHVGTQPVAFAWCRGQGRRMLYDTIGYLTEHSAHSPGAVLLFHILADLHAAGRWDVLDFGPGEAQYKAHFATRCDTAVDLYFVQSQGLNGARLQAHWILLRASMALSHWLDRTGLKKRIKQLVRRLRGVR